MTTVRAAFRAAAAKLRSAGLPDAETDAQRLLELALNRKSPLLAAHEHARLGGDASEKLERALSSRLARMPVSRIAGFRAFWKHEFLVNGNVLDPRPESELLVELGAAASPRRILDLGTGTGCLLLSILAECPDATGLGVDCSAAALEVASMNAKALGLEGRADFQVSNWLGDVRGRYDLIVANPPYVSDSDYSRLEPEVRLWDPEIALRGGAGGLDAYFEISAGAAGHLAAGGELLLEIGSGQGEDVCRIFSERGFAISRTAADLESRPRVLGFRPVSRILVDGPAEIH